jgi:hypothetical protein
MNSYVYKNIVYHKFICIYIHIYTCTDIYIYIYIYIYTRTWMSIRIYIHKDTFFVDTRHIPQPKINDILCHIRFQICI